MRVFIPNRVDKLLKDYRLPLWSTVGLIVVLLLLLLIRTYERGVLAGILGDNTTTGQDYANLINGDKDAELKKNAVGTDEAKTTATTNAGTSTASNESPPSTSSLTLDSDGGGVPPSTVGNLPPVEDGGSEPAPQEPFSAQIAGFGSRSQGVFTDCGGVTGPAGNAMCKLYEFGAGISTFNGPGTVAFAFRWQGPAPGESSGNFLASSGDAFTQVIRQVKLRCDQPGEYIFHFLLFQPSPAQSHNEPVYHNCGTAFPPTGS